jgi:hypothetical protein
MGTQNKRSLELVKNLSNKQKAALYFSLVCECNEAELDQLKGTIEWKEYTCLDMEFQKLCDNFIAIFSVFGMMYWREVAIGLKSIVINEQADTEELESIQRLAALRAAIAEFCNQHGIELADVVTFIGAGNWPQVPEAVGIDHEYQQKVLDQLNAAMPVL